MRLAYIAQGKLHLLEAAGTTRQIDSQFAQEFINRSVQIAERRAWKNNGGSGMWQGTNLWNVKDDFDPSAVRISFSDVTPGTAPGEIVYCLQTERVSGMFTYRLDEARETRLFHKNDFPLGDLCRRPGEATVVASLQKPSGVSHLIQFRDDSPHYQEITEGDSRDEAPHWSRHDPAKLLYQSAGVGRNGEGYCTGYGPSALMQLDMVTGELATLLESAGHDLLQPRTNAAGDVFFIRRPWQAEPWRQGYFLRALKDFVLFPFRLLRAFVDYLNVFSMVYSRKPLKTAGGPRLPEQDLSRALLRGRFLNVQKALDRYQGHDDAPALVPRDWELVKRGADGKETVLARGVSAFDVSADGAIVYSNGTGIFRLKDGTSERIGRSWMIEKLVLL